MSSNCYQGTLSGTKKGTTHVNEGSNVFLHDLGLVGSIIDIATRNKGCVTSINVTFISDYRNIYIIRIEYSPMTLD